MGCGASAHGECGGVEPAASSSSGKLTRKQWLELKGDADGYGPKDEFSDGFWYWGHPNGKDREEKPKGCDLAFQGLTAVLPDVYRDPLRLRHCPSHLDHMAWDSDGAKCPFFGGTTYMSHKDVVALVKECPVLHAQGKVERRNELGYLELDKGAFPLSGAIGLGGTPEVHRIQRPWLEHFAQKLPQRHGMLAEVHRFLRGRDRIEMPADLRPWWHEMLWKYMFGIELTQAEASEFVSFCSNWLAAAVLHVEGISIADLTFTMDDVGRGQERYRAKITAKLPSEISDEHKPIVSQGLLELLAFAGGLSVPQTIASAVAVLFKSEFMPEPVTEANVEAFVYEVTRLFPAVQGFAFWRDGHRNIAHLNGALRDPLAWGPDSNRFSLKDLEVYKNNHVGFAQPADTGDHDAKSCPGMHQALAVVQAFVLGISTWTTYGLSVDSVWRPVKPIEVALKPSWWKDYALERVPHEDRHFYEILLSDDFTGGKEIKTLSPVEVQGLISKIDRDRDHHPDVIDSMDFATQLLFVLAKWLWVDYSNIGDIDLPMELPTGQFTDADSSILLGNIRLPHEDEQWTGQPWLTEVGLDLSNKLSGLLSDAVPESCMITSPEERQQAIAMIQLAFTKPDGTGTYLPESKDPWPDLTSDHAQGVLARMGLGQLFARVNADPERAELGEIVCDCTFLGDVPVRPAFERLGAAAYFKLNNDEGAASEWQITAIDWKHGDRLVKAEEGGKDWEHAKWVWRCSMVAHMTAVHHLVWTHWMASNAFSTSAREALQPDHPIRRLLHANFYKTASVNYGSFLTLFPENCFLHRMTSFTYEGMMTIFKAGVDTFRHRTWPQVYKECDLPPEVKDTMPMFEDGLPLWHAMHDFYAGYIDLYYESEEALMHDSAMQEYWKFRCVPQLGEMLPPLTKASLAEQITQAVFDVTAYHELVGSTCQYVTDPSGMALQVRPGLEMADAQQLVNMCSLVASTGSPMPRYLDDWTRLLDLGPKSPMKNRFDDAKTLWSRLVDSLHAVSDQIALRNKTREHPCRQFDPQFLECSVSL